MQLRQPLNIASVCIMQIHGKHCPEDVHRTEKKVNELQSRRFQRRLVNPVRQILSTCKIMHPADTEIWFRILTIH